MHRSTLISNIVLEGEGLELGESVRLNCPVCQHSTFTVTRSQQGVLYNCYRNSCDSNLSSGFIGLDKVAREKMGPIKEKKRDVRFFAEDIVPLNLDQQGYLVGRFPIENNDISRSGIRYAPSQNKYVLPIFDPRGYVRGMDLHTWDKHADRKSIMYPHTPDGAMQSWYVNQCELLPHGTVVLVEDIMSAICISRLEGISGVALLGTSLGPDKLSELMNVNPLDVIVALDADAVDAAYEIAFDNKLLFRRIRAIKLEQDFKDMQSDDEMMEALYGS